jgi:putative ABC transport system permease protein
VTDGQGRASPKRDGRRWSKRLLAASLPDGARGESIASDLEQEFEELWARRGSRAARRWYRWEALKLSLHYRWARGRSSSRTDRGVGMIEVLSRNMRLAVRRLIRAPGFAAAAILTMALGIGANAAIFSVVRAVLLEPLPYDAPNELVAMWEWNLARDNRTNVANPGNVVAWRERTRSFVAVTGVTMIRPTTVTERGAAEESMVQYADPEFFRVLGMEPTTGRNFNTGPDALLQSEAILSSQYWQQRFGGDPDVVGRQIQINGQPVSVVGVLPRQYVVFGEQTELWVTFDMSRGDQTNTGRYIYPIGRLANGVTLESAQSEMTGVAAGLVEEFPDFNAGWSVNLVPLKEQVVGDISQGLWILLGAVGLLLLIACANVANLFLVRATERRREMAVRTSLGATGRSLAGQLLVESLLVAALGAGLGIILAHGGTLALAGRMPDAFGLPRIDGAGVDGVVLGFAVLLTLVTGLLFGVVPAIQVSGTKPAATLAAEGRGPSQGTSRLRSALVIGEVAVSVLLLAGAALFGRSLNSLLSVDPGIDPQHVLVGRINLAGPDYPEPGSKVAFFEELTGRIAATPGVVAVGGISFLPMDGPGAATSFYPGDRPPPAEDDRDAAEIRNVTSGYFSAMGIELMQGRLFSSEDHVDAPQTAVINRSLADKYWPGGGAIGQPLVINWVDETPWEIVGIVEDVRTGGLSEEPRTVVYLHYSRATFFPWLQIAVRGIGDANALTSVLRKELRAMNPALPLGSVRVMEDIVRQSSARPRMTTILMLVFAGLATVLAAVGLYGVLAYTVSQRVREIGVRIALGAQRGDVVRMVVGQGARLVLVGLAVGMVLALVGGRVVASMLFGVAPTDPIALGGAGVFLFVVAIAACLIPAWRAATVAPGVALRSE